MAKRLFIALEIPKTCREDLSALAAPIPGIRWLSADQLHLTLAFLGNVDADSERRLRTSLAVLRAPSLTLRLQGLGVFGTRKPAVIWVGVKDDGQRGLAILHRRIHQALEAAGIQLKPASFHPHITIARLKEAPTQKLRCFLEANRSRGFGLVEFRVFTLFSSRLGSRGAAHTAEERYPLVDGMPRSATDLGS